MDQFICSKMFTDVNIKFPYNCVKNCCKSNDYEIDIIDQHACNVFVDNKEYMRRKDDMLYHNKLPKGGCDTCIQAEPNSLFRDWNQWNNPISQDARDELYYSDDFSTYEFVLSSACDLKCVYCAPKDSSSWAKELGVPINKGTDDWKERILTDLFAHLRKKTYHTDNWFFFSGGEPTYNVETLPLIREIIEIVPNQYLNIIVSTNANAKPKVMEKYLEMIQDDPTVKWTFDCSIDGIGERAEAIRYGLNWNRTITNITTLLKYPNVTVRISPTVNLYSIPTMHEFLVYFYTLFARYGKIHQYMFNFNMVQEPELSPWSMPAHYADLQPAIDYCEMHDIKFAKHLRNVQALLGTKIDDHTANHIETKLEYFKAKRPDTDWEKLFPHVRKIIDELNQ